MNKPSVFICLGECEQMLSHIPVITFLCTKFAKVVYLHSYYHFLFVNISGTSVVYLGCNESAVGNGSFAFVNYDTMSTIYVSRSNCVLMLSYVICFLFFVVFSAGLYWVLFIYIQYYDSNHVNDCKHASNVYKHAINDTKRAISDTKHVINECRHVINDYKHASNEHKHDDDDDYEYDNDDEYKHADDDRYKYADDEHDECANDNEYKHASDSDKYVNNDEWDKRANQRHPK